MLQHSVSTIGTRRVQTLAIGEVGESNVRYRLPRDGVRVVSAVEVDCRSTNAQGNGSAQAPKQRRTQPPKHVPRHRCAPIERAAQINGNGPYASTLESRNLLDIPVHGLFRPIGAISTCSYSDREMSPKIDMMKPERLQGV